jgi:hypothetical protein
MSEEVAGYRAWCAVLGYTPNDWALGEYRKAQAAAENLEADALALMQRRGQSTDPARPEFYHHYRTALLDVSAERLTPAGRGPVTKDRDRDRDPMEDTLLHQLGQFHKACRALWDEFMARPPGRWLGRAAERLASWLAR